MISRGGKAYVRKNYSSDFSLDYLSSMIFTQDEKGQICVIHECYLDDSKDQTQSVLFVCAGFYGTRSAWRDFDNDWRAQLRKEGIEYFKTSEFKGLSGEFEKFKLLPFPYGRQAANLVRDRLVAIVAKHKSLHGIGVVVPVSALNRVIQQHEGADLFFSKSKMYLNAFDMTLLEATSHACRRGDRIVFVHDGGDDFPLLFAQYLEFRKVNVKTAKHIAGLQPMDDKTTPALQIADMIANSVMSETREFYMGKSANSDAIFIADRSTFYEYTQQFAEVVLADNMDRLNIVVPESLMPALEIAKSIP